MKAADAWLEARKEWEEYKRKSKLGHVSTEDVRNCINGTCNCDNREISRRVRQKLEDDFNATYIKTE